MSVSAALRPGTIDANIALFLIFCVFYVSAGAALLRYIVKRHLRQGFVKVNYRGERIPTGMGAFLWVMLLAGTLPILHPAWGYASEGSGSAILPLVYLLCLSGVFAAGWADDRFGDRKVKGLLGHVRQLLLHGHMTTGMLKAAAGIALAAFFSYMADRAWGDRLFHMTLIAMSMNAVNLLDLRPGRALKFFIAVSCFLLISAFAGRKPELWHLHLYPLTAAALVLLPSDLRARTMLGDCGANLLGFALGCGLALMAGFYWQLAAAAALAVMHVAAERLSFTAVIERNAWLNWLDRLGRTEK